MRSAKRSQSVRRRTCDCPSTVCPSREFGTFTSFFRLDFAISAHSLIVLHQRVVQEDMTTPVAGTTTLEHVVGSTAAGCASTLLGHPLDTVKAHLQTNVTNGGTTTMGIVRELRWKGLFRGITPPLINSIVMNTVMFSVFDGVVQRIHPDPFLAGLISGFATAMISTPTDYLKIQAQLHGRSTRTVIYETMTVSPHLFYRGHLANLAREGVFTMAYLGLYVRLKETTLQPETQVDSSQSLLRIALTSSLTGALAWIISYPFDTIKTIIQSGKGNNLGGMPTYASVLKGRTLKEYFKGCGTSTGRAMLVTSSRMIAYEMVLQFMNKGYL